MKVAPIWLHSRRIAFAATTGTVVAALTVGCGVGGPDVGGTGQSVPVGASKQEYVDALAEFDPIELTIQSNQAPGIGQSIAIERYTETVTDWSGGKINFDIVYSGAIAPIAEAGRAITDGLLDMAFWSYSTSQDSYPVAALLQETFFMHEPGPVSGPLELLASAAEQASDQDELRTELQENGLHSLLPLLPTSSSTLLCKGTPVTSLADSRGKNVAPSGAKAAEEFKALGFTVVDIPFGEVFDAMQRGVTDCQGSPETALLVSGLFEIGDHWTISNELAMTATPSAFDISEVVWNSLPLPAQQLLWDRLDVLIEGYVDTFVVEIPSEAVARAQSHNVEIHALEPDADAALKAHHNSRLAALAEKTVDGVEGADVVENAYRIHEKWRGILDELGLTEDVSWAEYPAWLEANPVDSSVFAERFMQEAISGDRPE